jgi:hypothetical protein
MGSWPLIPHSPAARSGVVQVSETDAGILISGDVAGPTPRWPASVDRMAEGDHVELWLADVDAPALPPVGWGNQFGYEWLAAEQDCMAERLSIPDTLARQWCTQWYRKQLRYRGIARRLFVRQWQLAPGMTAEVFATPAYTALDSSGRLALAPLEPAGEPHGEFASRAGRGYRFEVLVPWDAFPPMQSLRFTALRVMADVFSPGTAPRRYGPFSTTSTTRKWGDPTTFPAVQLPEPRAYYLTPCREPPHRPVLESAPDFEALTASDSARVYYRPTGTLDLRRLIVLDSRAVGYQYAPDSTTWSPVALRTRYWSEQEEGGDLCGPRLAYAEASGVARSDFVVALPDSLEVHQLANGDFLLEAGPRVVYSAFGSGQCGACPRVTIAMYYVDRAAHRITEALNYVDVAEQEESDIDVSVSPDFSEVTIFRGTYVSPSDTVMRWTSVTHCFDAAHHAFAECRHADRATPPSPRRVTPFP